MGEISSPAASAIPAAIKNRVDGPKFWKIQPEIGPPSSDDVYAFLTKRWPEASECERRRIAVFWAGNVGGALNELNSYWLQAA